MNKAFLLGLMLVLLAGITIAVPGPAHLVGGSVTVNGAPAKDGTTVTATVDGVTRGVATTIDGIYGNPFMVISDPNGNYGESNPEIKFYVNGHDTGVSITFVSGGEDIVDLSATYTVTTPPSDGGSSGGGGGGGGGGGLPPADLWDCTEWTECIDGTQTQECTQNDAVKTNTRDCDETKSGSVDTNTASGSDEGSADDNLMTGPGTPPEEGEDLEPTGAAVGAGGLASWIYMLGILVIVIAALLAIFLAKKGKKGKAGKK